MDKDAEAVWVCDVVKNLLELGALLDALTANKLTVYLCYSTASVSNWPYFSFSASARDLRRYMM